MNPHCLIPECEYVGKSCRGLCLNHYSSVWKFVQKGMYTWEQLESVGLAHPKVVDRDATFKLRFKDMVEAKEKMKKNNSLHPWKKFGGLIGRKSL